MSVMACLRLARFHQPIGIALLWAPVACALWIATGAMPEVSLIALFFSGTLLMRGAGCVINDMIDRRIDIHIARTCKRPLASGEVSLFAAFITLFCLLLPAFLLLFLLPLAVIPYALIALGITCIYPLGKRFIDAPQCVLGVAFSMGIPMAFIAVGTPFNAAFVLLCLINYLWIIAYDTQYAMIDRKDDLRAGVKSTAVWLGHWDRRVIGLLQAMVQGMWLLFAFSFSAGFLVAWCMGSMIFIYQQKLIASRTPEQCMQAFRLNGWYGMILWVGIVISLNLQ